MDQIVNLRRRLLFSHSGLGIQLNIDRTVNYLLDSVKKYNFPNTTPLGNYNQLGSDIENLIAGLRTDLDAFHDVEIELLMWSGAIRMDLAIKSLVPHILSSEKWIDIPNVPTYDLKSLKEILLKGQNRKTFARLHKNLKK